jgi:outer membrane protein OmpA-like peptidoglycan-associated protein
MNSPKNERRRGRSRTSSGQGRNDGPSGPVRTDPLVDLRYALQCRDPDAFAGYFTPSGWIRVPRPGGDVVFQGQAQIAQAGHELAEVFGDFSWTPSQRFLAAGQVVEEAVVQARKAPDAADEEIRVSARAVTALDPSGAVGSLTLWIDWAALNDPLGVASARGAASALVASARAQDARGLRVIQSGPATTALPIQPPAPPPPPPAPLNRMRRPSRGAVWWQRHRRTIAGSVMALLTVALLGWVTQTVRHSPSNQAGGSTAGPATGAAGATRAAAGTGAKPTPRASSTAASTVPTTGLPVIESQKPTVKPTVQPGQQFLLQSDVLFETGSAKLSASTRSTLKKAAAAVRSHNLTGIIQLNGYTDSVGGTAQNLKLSHDRAFKVAKALRGYLNGADVTLLPQAFGEADPVADNSTLAGRQLNRRVIIVLPKH